MGVCGVIERVSCCIIMDIWVYFNYTNVSFISQIVLSTLLVLLVLYCLVISC